MDPVPPTRLASLNPVSSTPIIRRGGSSQLEIGRALVKVVANLQVTEGEIPEAGVVTAIELQQKHAAPVRLLGAALHHHKPVRVAKDTSNPR